MKQFVICLFLIGAVGLHAQDKIVLRNGRTIEVQIQRNLEDRVEYTYSGEKSVYERPKTAISYILFSDGRKEICDKKLIETGGDKTQSNRASSQIRNNAATDNRQSAPPKSNATDNEIFWQDVKTTFAETDVVGMNRMQRISATSKIGYKDAIQQLKKKAATIGGTTILVMDAPDSEGAEVEVMGIVFRDENAEITPKSSTERNSAPAESDSNIRRRRVAQQMAAYSGTNVEPANDKSTKQQSTRNSSPQRSEAVENDSEPDAIYLMNERVIRGTIEEFEPDDFVSIRTAAGKVYEYSMEDVKRVSRGKSSTKQTTARNDSRQNRTPEPKRERSINDDYTVATGYQGIFDAGYVLPMGGTGEQGRLEIGTSHGYKLNDYLFVGAGVGFHMYSARSPELKKPNSYPHYVVSETPGAKFPIDSITYMHAVDSAYMTLPVFVDVRGYYPIPGLAITPFAMLRVGYTFNISDNFGGMGLYFNPAIGVKYQMTQRIGLNFSVGYSYQNYGGVPKDGGYGYWYIKDKAGDDATPKVKYEATGAGGILLKLGVEF